MYSARTRRSRGRAHLLQEGVARSRYTRACTDGEFNLSQLNLFFLVEGETWSTHPKIIQTTPQRGLRRAVPPNFPYFYVQWESTMCPHGHGYVHVIEDEVHVAAI